MSQVRGDGNAVDPNRVLNGQILRQLRPLSVRGLAEVLRSYERFFHTVQLLEEFFPPMLEEYERLQAVRHKFTLERAIYQREPEVVGWWQVLAHFFNLVEHNDWFPINWKVISEAGECWLSPEYTDRGELLATYINYIPLTLYGLTDKSIEKYPPLELLHALLFKGQVKAVSAQLLAEAEIYDTLDTWTEQDKANAWGFLRRIENDPGPWPDAVRTLPALARYACHTTGNIVLDGQFNPYNQEGPWCTWTNHTIQIQASWQRAKLALHWFDRLMKWYTHEPARLTSLAHFLIEGAEIEQKLSRSTQSETAKNQQLYALIGGMYELNW